MRRLFLLLCFLLLIFSSAGMVFSTTEAASATQISANGTVMVKMDGRAPAGQEAKAIEAAKKRAVFKVFSHMTRPDKDPNSTFAKMMSNYNKYIVSAKLDRKMNGANGMQVIMDVEVSVRLLKNDFEANVFGKQLNNDELKSSLMIRSSGTSNPQLTDEEVLTAFNKRFNELGFQFEYASEINEKITATRSLANPDYEKEMMKPIQQNEWMVTVAVIGEIALTSIEKNPLGTGYYAKAVAIVKSYDTTANNKIIGTIHNDYSMLANTPAEAERLVIQKASMDAAESIAQQTLQYWRQH